MNIDYDNNFEAGKIIVSLNKNINYFESQTYYAVVLNRIEYEKSEVIFHSKGNTGDILLVYLKNKDKSAVIDAVSKLSADPNVSCAEPDYLLDMHDHPNDPYYTYLWGLHKIKVSSAWDCIKGTADVVVGVTDSGIDYEHPDIKDNMWISPNGQCGWNFLYDNGNSMDTSGHGTHTAGTIGATGNNSIGITGICWNVKIASLKIGDTRIDLAAAIASIDFANENCIPILNNSWGGRRYSPGLKIAIEQYDGLFIASAGNNGTNNDIIPNYPSCFDCDNIISVAASTPDNSLASFSNYGVKSVDIAAPGIDILSLALHGGYSYSNGTSMAAPHVSGAAALLKSYIPHLTVSDIKNIILLGADSNDNLEGKVSGGILNVKKMFDIANFFICSADVRGGTPLRNFSTIANIL